MRCHHFAHRYAMKFEGPKDKITWHCAVLIEWDHGRHTTVAELAWMCGLGGYNGRSNFYADRDAKRTALYDSLPACLKRPWRPDFAEARLLDVAARDVGEFKAFLAEHTGGDKRFLDPSVSASADVKLMFRSQEDISRMLLNYVRHEGAYSEAGSSGHNCQTFAADFFALLSGQHGTEPYSHVNRLMWKQHLDWFLCDPPTPKEPPANATSPASARRR